MKKILLLLLAVFVLVGCTQQASQPEPISDVPEDKVVAQDVKSYKNHELNVSFDYPVTWDILDESIGVTDGSVSVLSPSKTIFVRFPAPTFAEYESDYSELIGENKMTIKEAYPTNNKNYPTKEYAQHGILTYLINMNENFVGVGTEQYLNDQQKEEVSIILDSINFGSDFTVEGDKVTVNSEDLTFTFTDGLKTAGSIIEFGPETEIPESPTDKIYTRPAFRLTLLPKRSFEEIKEVEDATSEFNLETVNEMQVAKWEESTFCERHYYEIIGETQNVQIVSRNCGFSLDPKEYLDGVLELIEN